MVGHSLDITLSNFLCYWVFTFFLFFFLSLEFCNKHPLYTYLYRLVLLFHRPNSQKWIHGSKGMWVLGWNGDGAYCLRCLPRQGHVIFTHWFWFCPENTPLISLLQDHPQEGILFPSVLKRSSDNTAACPLWLVWILLKVQLPLGWPPAHWKTPTERDSIFSDASGTVGEIQVGRIQSSVSCSQATHLLPEKEPLCEILRY